MTLIIFCAERGQKNPVFQHYQCNIVTVSLKTEVVIKIFEFEIKASSTTLQFLSVHKNSLQFQTVDVKVA